MRRSVNAKKRGLWGPGLSTVALQERGGRDDGDQEGAGACIQREA